MKRAQTILSLALATFTACMPNVGDEGTGSGGGSGSGEGEVHPAGTPQPIAKLQCARKMALDLTHQSPSLEDLQALDSGNTTLDELAEKYLASPEFAKVSFDWMRSEFPPTSTTTAETDVEEPARIMHHVLMADKDWREIMTATYTVDASGNEVPITDRPAAGIISTKYSLQSTVGSFRRNWAGRFERQFVGITLVAVTLPPGDMSDVSPDGLAANPNCAGCHVHPTYGIDPLAKFAECYDENGARKAGCVDPESTFLLKTGAGLADLGRITANTNEFKSQGVNFFFKRLFGRDLAKSEAGFYSEMASAFAASGYQAKALIKNLVTSEAYCSR